MVECGVWMFKSIEVNWKVALWCRPNSLMRLAGLWLLCGWIVVGCLGQVVECGVWMFKSIDVLGQWL